MRKVQKEIIIGCLLSDGSVSHPLKKKNRFSIGQAEKNKDFIYHLKEKLNQYLYDVRIVPPRKLPSLFPSGRLRRQTPAFRVTSRSKYNGFPEIEKLFYKNGKRKLSLKTLPLDIGLIILGIILSLWLNPFFIVFSICGILLGVILYLREKTIFLRQKSYQYSKVYLDDGQTYNVRATVKKHDEYKGKKQTIVTRLKVL